MSTVVPFRIIALVSEHDESSTTTNSVPVQNREVPTADKRIDEKINTFYNKEKHLPVALSLTSRYLSWVTGTVDRFVTTPLLTVLGMTVPVMPGSLPLLGQRCRVGAAPFSVGIRRKSLTS